MLPSDPAEDRALIAAAVRTARKADVIVLAIGGNEQTSREAWSLEHMGDRTSLDLIGRQDELVRALLALGKPVVVLLFNGRPLSIREVAESAPAILECWYLGQETGTAIAEVLFGDSNPSGKLPITIPRSVGHVPAFYNHKPSARRGYLVRRCFAAVRIRLRAELHLVRILRAAVSEDSHPARRIHSLVGGCEKHRNPRRRGDRPTLHSRSDQLSDSTGERTQRLPARCVATGRNALCGF